MFDQFISNEALRGIATVVILLATVYSFVREKVSPDLTSLLSLLALMLTGILTPREAFSGFSHPATISVAAMLVLSAGIERTGVLSLVARRVLAPLGRSEILLTAVIMVVVGGISAFINNTAAVAIFIPIVLDVCRRSSIGPGRVLMPMAHAATIGGMCTLVGTSTNLVAHEFALQQGLPGFSMFELGQVGLPMVAASFLYMLLIGRWALPSKSSTKDLPLVLDREYVAELIVVEHSDWIGKSHSEEAFVRDFDVEIVGLMRNRQAVDTALPGWQLSAGDSLWIQGPLENLLRLAHDKGVTLHRPECAVRAGEPGVIVAPLTSAPTQVKDSPHDALILAEAVVLTSSGLIGKTLKDVRFAERFDATVLALRRRGALRNRPSEANLRAGDLLVLEGSPEALGALAKNSGFLVIGAPVRPEQRPARLTLTLLTLAAVVIAVSTGLAPIVIAATAGCLVLVLAGVLQVEEAYNAIDLRLVFLLAGSLALGLALEKTGITLILAQGLSMLTGTTGPYVMLGGFFLASVMISELMSNSGTVALLGPIALSTAAQMGVNPMTFLVAVTFGSSAAFAMPIGYQTSLMIYGPGGYSVKDFLRMGLALDLILAILALWLIPRFWPL